MCPPPLVFGAQKKPGLDRVKKNSFSKFPLTRTRKTNQSWYIHFAVGYEENWNGIFFLRFRHSPHLRPVQQRERYTWQARHSRLWPSVFPRRRPEAQSSHETINFAKRRITHLLSEDCKENCGSIFLTKFELSRLAKSPRALRHAAWYTSGGPGLRLHWKHQKKKKGCMHVDRDVIELFLVFVLARQWPRFSESEIGTSKRQPVRPPLPF